MTSIVFSVVQGTASGMLSMGIVGVYRVTGGLDVAQGEFGTGAAYLMVLLAQRLDVPYAVSALLAVGIVVGAGLAGEAVTTRRSVSGLGRWPPSAADATPDRRRAPNLRVVLGTAAVALFAIGMELATAGRGPRPLPAAVHGGPIRFLGADVVPQQLLLLGVSALAVGAVLALRRTGLGGAFAPRGSVRDPFATRTGQVSRRDRVVSRTAWGVAALLGAVTGILEAPLLGVSPAFLTAGPGAALLPAIAGAVLVGMRDPLWAFAASVAVGLVQGLAVHVLGSHVPGTPELAVFAILVASLLRRPRAHDAVAGAQVA